MLAAALAGCAAPPATTPSETNNVDANEDPYLWLEDVHGARAMRWVREQNRATLASLAERPAVRALRGRLRAVFDAPERIPGIDKIGDYYYNFWRDLDHPRGLWRRTTLAEYRNAAPAWEAVLDIDALAKRERENWVLKNFACRQPDYRRCLVSLSRGGADAVVTREFDLPSKAFVAAKDGAFTLPEAKARVSWAGPDAVFVATDFGPGSMTDSGYPRIVKLWRRGQPLAAAEVVFAGDAADVSVAAYADLAPGHEVQLVWRARDFYNSDVFVRRPDDGELVPIAKPSDAELRTHRGRLFLELKTDWAVDGQVYSAGSLLTAELEPYLRRGGADVGGAKLGGAKLGESGLAVLFAPGAGQFLAGYAPTRDYVLLNVLDNVRSRVYVAAPPDAAGDDAAWQRRPLFPNQPDESGFRTIRVEAVAADEDNRYFAHANDHLTPATLFLGAVGEAPQALKQAPAHFDAAGLATAQHWATSADGTRVPYFQVGPADATATGPRRTLLYGYGGFENALVPAYSGGVGIGWLERGGVYVVANIRGGGEFGPAWHRAALRERRGRAFEDFIAVAEDLVARGVTEPAALGILGGSNGGLLMGNMLTMRPRLFGAVAAMVPLLDMRRYHRLLAGASWMAEYGDPDDPEDWRFLQRYSPYHNLRPDVRYPPFLATTSTRDDRVHPGHARKMVAKMRAMGLDATYYENTEGGHGGAANNAQSAFVWALVYEFLWRELKPTGERG